MIRVAFDGQARYGKKSGLGVYVTALVEAIKQEAPADIQVDVLPECEDRFCGSLKTPVRFQWEVLEFPKRVKKSHYDIAHIPAFSMGWPQAKTVLTVHDLIGMAFPNQKGVASKFYWGQWLPWAARRADHIITDSQHTRSDLMKLLKIPEGKITIIYPSGHEAYVGSPESGALEKVKARLSLCADYFLCVGTLEPRKNLRRVIEAYQVFLRSNPNASAQLVLVGAQDFAGGTFYENLFKNAEHLKKKIIFSGYLEHAELHALYSGATALLFPSLYEGFGLPILEAMATSCPVVTSRASSLPEVAGEAALYVDPHSAESIAQAMQVLDSDPKKCESLIAAGKERVKSFSWKQTALQTFDVYRRVSKEIR